MTQLSNRQLNHIAPRGYLINGKISVTVASNNLTVAIKTLADADPSPSDPIYCRIGDTVRSLTAALSKEYAAGTNWWNAGSAELATKEVDYFVILADEGGNIRLGVSRYPGGQVGGDWVTTTTAEKYGGWNNTPGATDACEIIGRFAATLSAGAGYTWSVPTFTASNLIQRPIYNTRLLSCVTSASQGVTSPTYGNQIGQYKITDSSVFFRYYLSFTGGTNAGTEFRCPTPFSAATTTGVEGWIGSGKFLDSGVAHYVQICSIQSGNRYFCVWNYNGAARLASLIGTNGDFIEGSITYEI